MAPVNDPLTGVVPRRLLQAVVDRALVGAVFFLLLIAAFVGAQRIDRQQSDDQPFQDDRDGRRVLMGGEQGDGPGEREHLEHDDQYGDTPFAGRRAHQTRGND